MAWTKEQQQVIDERGGDLLVAAAAGSGKTAVLVERIVSMVCDKENPVDIDQMVIVTFTKAAATEMKERITRKIEEKIEENPDDEHIRKQVAYVQKAQISTIHSFCLQVIRENFHLLGIDPEFRLMDEGEGKLLKAEVMEEVLEQFYEEGAENFHLLVESYTTGKDDKKLEQLVEQLYDFSMSDPNPVEWLKEGKNRFFIENEEQLFSSSYMLELLDSTKQLLQELLDKNQLAIEIGENENGLEGYVKTLHLDKEYLEDIASSRTYEEYKSAMDQGKFPTIGRATKDADPDKKDLVKGLRDEVKEELIKWQEQFFTKTGKEMLEEVELVKKPMEALIDVVLVFRERFLQKKGEKNLLDFNDLEHYALQLLVAGYENGMAIPSKIAQEMSRSYCQIFIDEYQDSNFVQEAILSSVSGYYRNEKNRFMVGDVKQSIYRFRLARPELFMEKYSKYGTGDAQEKKIELHNNFRSRASVLESTNYIFRQIMGRDLGGVDYDDAAALVPSKQFPKRIKEVTSEENVWWEENQGETLPMEDVNHIEKEDETECVFIEVDEDDYTKKELEAYAIASKIKELMNGEEPYCIYDDKKKAYRPVTYKDIVILLRTVGGWGEVFEEVLAKEGIPAYCDSQSGYFSAFEVKTVLQLLMVVDNRFQEIPLTGVLRSPIVGLSEEELAWLKACYGKYEGRELSFYDSLSLFAEDEFEETEQLLLGKDTTWCKLLQEKIEQFLQLIDDMEYGKTCLSIRELIWLGLNKTGFYHYVGAMPQGEKRQENLEMLIEKANQYESVSYKGLFHFIRYIEQLNKYEVDFGEANLIGENENVVRIMSIHKSKGLEFPVVFVGELSKNFNFTDIRQSLLIHPDDYLGPDCVNMQTRETGATWMKQLMERKLKEEMLGEELRVLYVAMTRAKEKLILVGSIDSYEKLHKKYSYIAYEKGKDGAKQLLNRSIRKGAGCYLDWIFPSLIRPYPHIQIHIKKASEFVVEEVKKELLLESKREELLHLQPEGQWEKEQEEMERLFTYQYPYEQEINIQGKYSVSELKKASQLEDGEELHFVFDEKIEETEPFEPTRPAFMEENQKETGAKRGSIIHKGMELLDITKTATKEDIVKQIICLEEKGIFTEEQRQYFPVQKVWNLFQSELGKRLIAANQMGQLHKESQYMMAIPVTEVYPDINSEETVLVQGIIDLWFQEGEELVLLDYKTDRVNEEKELIERYMGQMKLYQKALEQLTGKTVKECYIYSFYFGKSIEVVMQ